MTSSRKEAKYANDGVNLIFAHWFLAIARGKTKRYAKRVTQKKYKKVSHTNKKCRLFGVKFI